MKIKPVFLLVSVISAILTISCGGGSGRQNPSALEVLYADLPDYSMTLPDYPSDTGSFTSSGKPIVTLALGLNIPDTGASNLDISFDLSIGDDPTPYKLYATDQLDTDILTIDEIKAFEASHLTIPLYWGKQIYDKLNLLTEATECRIKITFDPQNRQTALTLPSKEIAVIFIPQRLFDLPPSGQDKQIPPYKNRYFNEGYNEGWGIQNIAYLSADLSASATWEPLDQYPKIPYAMGLISHADVHINVFSNNLQILKTLLEANANMSYLTSSGYKANLELFGNTLFNEYRYLKPGELTWSWTPKFQKNIPETLLPKEYEVWIGNTRISIKAKVDGTLSVDMPGNLDLSGNPWKLNQDFTPAIQSRLLCSITASDTNFGILAPMMLTDAQLRFRLYDTKIYPSVPSLSASIEWPGDYTLLKGSIIVTYKGKPLKEIYKYAIIDKNVIMRQKGYIRASGTSLQVYPGMYKEQIPRQ